MVRTIKFWLGQYTAADTEAILPVRDVKRCHWGMVGDLETEHRSRNNKRRNHSCENNPGVKMLGHFPG